MRKAFYWRGLTGIVVKSFSPFSGEEFTSVLMWQHSREAAKHTEINCNLLQQALGKKFWWFEVFFRFLPTGSSSIRICCRNGASPDLPPGFSDGHSLPQTSVLVDPTVLKNPLIMQLFCALINFSLLLGEQQLWGLLTEWITGKISSCLYELSPHPLTRFLVGFFFCVWWLFPLSFEIVFNIRF